MQVWKTDLVNGYVSFVSLSCIVAETVNGRTYGLLVLNATPHTKTVNASMYDFFIDEASSRSSPSAPDLCR